MSRLRKLAALIGATGVVAALVVVAPGVTDASPVPLSGTPGTIETVVGGNRRDAILQPRALAAVGSTLYIADTQVKSIFARDLTTGVTTRIAGVYESTNGIAGLGGPAIDADLNDPDLITADTAGNVYFTMSGLAVYKIDTSGILTLFAGAGAGSADGDGGPATAANIGYPSALAVDSAGQVLIADEFNCVIRRVDGSGDISTIAGVAGQCGDTGDGGPAGMAELSSPQGLAADGSDNVYVLTADARVRRIDATTGDIETVVGTGSPGNSGDGGPLLAADIGADGSLAVASDGALLIGNTSEAVMRRADLTNDEITTVIGTGSTVTDHFGENDRPASGSSLTGTFVSVAVSADGAVYLADDTQIRRIDPVTLVVEDETRGTVDAGDGGPATDAILDHPYDLVRVGTTLFIVDAGARQIRAVDLTTGVIRTIAGTGSSGYTGDGGPATHAKLLNPTAIAAHDGSLYVADVTRIRRIDLTTGVISTFAGNGVVLDPSVLAGLTPEQVSTAIGDGGPAIDAPLFVSGLSFTRDGRMLLAEGRISRIRQIDQDGIISTIVGSVTIDMTVLNDVHTLVGMTREQADAAIGDGGLATDAFLAMPERVIERADGAIVFSDMLMYRVRQVDPATGIVTTIAGGAATSSPTNGDGGLAVDAKLPYPVGLRYDAAGNLEVLAAGESRVRRVDAVTGEITTIAGTGIMGYSGDGGPATSADLGAPVASIGDAGTHLFIAEHANGAVRRIEGARPNLVVNVADPGAITIGGSGHVNVAVSNNGAGWATGPVVAAVVLPVGLSYVSASSADWSCVASADGATCTSVASLAPGASRTFTLDVLADGAATGLVSMTIVSTSDSDDLNPTSGTQVLGITITAAETVVTIAPPVTPTTTAAASASESGTAANGAGRPLAGALPRTGAGALGALGAALGLLLLGAMCVGGAATLGRTEDSKPRRST